MNAMMTPDNLKLLEETRYLLQNNLPIPRMSLYMILPEAFTYEIEDLVEMERKKIAQNKLLMGIVS